MLVRALIYLLSVLTLASCQREPYPCLKTESCLCDSQSIKCACKGHETVDVFVYANLTEAVTITVEGCNAVHMRFAALWYVKVKLLQIKNINKLNIEHFSLTRVNHISNFVLENIADLELDLFALTGFRDTNSVVLRNVTAKNFTQYAVIGIGIEHFLIENCRLNMQPFSIILANVTEFAIKSSYFEHISNTSFLVQTSGTMFIHNTEFASADPQSLIFFNVENLKVSKCLFDVLPYGFFWGDADNFFFQRNHIENSETDSFLHLSVNKTAEFKFNVFKSLEENSIFPNQDNNISSSAASIEFAGNKIHCDCRLSWIFNNVKLYLPFIQSSVCQNYRNIKLTELLELVHSNITCNFSGYKEQKTFDLDQFNFLPQGNERIPVNDAALNCKALVIFNIFISTLFTIAFLTLL